MAEEIFDPLRRTVEGVATGVGDVVGGIGKGISSAVGGVGDAVGGLLGGFQNMPADDRMALINTLGRTGAALMALGQPGYNPKLRQQAIMALGNVPGQVATDRYKFAQTKLMQAAQQAKLRELEDTKRFGLYIKTPEGIAAMGKIGFTPEKLASMPVTAVLDMVKRMPIMDASARELQQLSLTQKRAEVARLKNFESLSQRMVNDTENLAQETGVPPNVIRQFNGDASSFIGAMKARASRVPAKLDKFQLWRLENPGASVNEYLALTNTPKYEGEQQKQLGKNAAQMEIDVTQAGINASKTITRLESLGRLLEGAQTGKMANIRGNIAAWGKAAGLSDERLRALGFDPKMAISQQAATALINEYVVGKIGGPGGFPANNFSDADRKFVTEIFPSIANIPEANAIIIKIMAREAGYSKQKNLDWQKYKKEKGGKASIVDFLVEWDQKRAKNSIITNKEKEELNAIINRGNKVTPSSAAAQPTSGATRRDKEVKKQRIRVNGRWVEVEAQ